MKLRTEAVCVDAEGQECRKTIVELERGLGEQLPGAFKKKLPLVGQGDVAFLTREELHAQFILQVLDLTGERRLGKAQLGGGGEAHLRGDGNEIAQVTKLRKNKAGL